MWEPLTLISPAICKKTSSSEVPGSHTPFDLIASFVSPSVDLLFLSFHLSKTLALALRLLKIYQEPRFPGHRDELLITSRFLHQLLLQTCSPALPQSPPEPGHHQQLSKFKMTHLASCIFLRIHLSCLFFQLIGHFLPSLSSFFRFRPALGTSWSSQWKG